MQITKVGTQASQKKPEDWFPGSAPIDPLFSPNEARRNLCAIGKCYNPQNLVCGHGLQVITF